MKFSTRKLLLFFVLFFASIAAKGVTANFTADYITGCSPLVVHFTNSSSGATSYFWNLGNGDSSHLANPSTSYITAGTFTVTLTAYNGTSSSTHTITITVYPSPVVSFTASDTAICPGSAIAFTSTSTLGTSGAGTYTWAFGDGSSSTAASPTHVYGSPGFYNVSLVVTNSEGCTTSLTIGAYIHVFTPPVAGFSASSTYVCNPPGSITFSSSGTTGSSPFTYVWSFGDGTTGTGASPTHSYSSGGPYTVKLYVTDAHGCMDTLTRISYINTSSATASFTSVTTACVNTPVTFYNTSTSHSSSTWSFGDGSTSGSDDSATHAYTSGGTYTVRLIIFTGPCADTVYHTITILPAPAISFTMSPPIACPAPATITFTGSVPGGSSVAWTFGDGGTGTGATTTHTYSSNGIYVINMSVTDASGCTNSLTLIDTIRDLNLTIIPDVFHGCIPLTVHFSDSISTTIPIVSPYPAGIASYHWNFGDGSAISTAAFPAHTYTATGDYTVVLTITTTNGCTATMSVGIETGTEPVVSFTDTPSVICYGRPIDFYAHVDSGGPVTYYAWDWGDGTTSIDTLAHTTHVATRPGFDTVTLVGYNNGCPGPPYRVYPITIDSPMSIINFSYDCSPYDRVTFRDSSYGDDSHEWFFGDGTTSTADSVIHTYPGTGTYICSLATYNIRSGCRDTFSEPIVLVPPVLNVTVSDSAICAGQTVTLIGTITGGYGTQWYINLNSGSGYGVGHGTLPGTDDTISIPLTDSFPVAGRYGVQLVVYDWHQCFDTFTHNDWIVVAKPVDSFTATPPRGCWPLTVTFTDHSRDDSGVSITSYLWSFGDGTSSTSSSVTTYHTYTAAGVYAITEIATDNVGCKDTLVRPALITVSRPHAAFAASNVYPCLGQPVSFTNSSTGGIASYLWMYGDGTTSTATSASHTYIDTGVYTVRLAVVDTNGCRDTATYIGYITVSKPHAVFTVSDSFSICPPLTVNFFNYSTGGVSNAWSLGDGTSSTLVSPSDLYVTPALYVVSLIVTNSHGCKDTAIHDVIIYGYAGAFSYTPDSGCSPLTVRFHADISNVPNIIWDFADGTTTTASMVDSTVHTYTLPGAYIPKLILSDNTGCKNSSLGLDTIKVDAVIPGFTTVPHPVCINTDINFKDTSFSYFSTITAWHWVFTNGDTSDLSAPPYFYNTLGSYPVTLYVTDAWGCKANIKDTVIVYPPPTITVSPDTIICVSDSATLQGYGGVSYTWSPTATLGCPTCQTTKASPTVVTTYTVTGTDINGCSNTDSVTVSLRTLTVSRGWGDTDVCDKIPVQLFDTGGTKYNWIPATGLSNPHIYDPIATPPYTTNYMIIAQYGGCIPDTNYVTVVVYPLPTVTASPFERLIAGSQAQLDATGTNINKYSWSPPLTLSCDTCANPIASMMNTTTYTITVTTVHGCEASDTVTIALFCDNSQVFIPNTFTPNGDGQNDVFYPRGSGISNIKTFRIYNRWGELLFERQNININDISNAWDGSYNGSEPKPGVYVYFMDAVCDTGQPLFIKGDVTVIR